MRKEVFKASLFTRGFYFWVSSVSCKALQITLCADHAIKVNHTSPWSINAAPITTLPPPCFTVGVMFWFWNAECGKFHLVSLQDIFPRILRIVGMFVGKCLDQQWLWPWDAHMEAIFFLMVESWPLTLTGAHEAPQICRCSSVAGRSWEGSALENFQVFCKKNLRGRFITFFEILCSHPFFFRSAHDVLLLEIFLANFISPGRFSTGQSGSDEWERTKTMCLITTHSLFNKGGWLFLTYQGRFNVTMIWKLHYMFTRVIRRNLLEDKYFSI